jgi:segregation and condensation protein B
MNGQADAPEGGKDETAGAAAGAGKADAARNPAAGQATAGAGEAGVHVGLEAAAGDDAPVVAAGPGTERNGAAEQDGAGTGERTVPAGPAVAADDDSPSDGAGAGADDEAVLDAAAASQDSFGEGPSAGAAAAPDGEVASVAGEGTAESQPGQGAEHSTDAAEGAADAAGPVPGESAGDTDTPDPALLAEGARIAEALIFASDRPVTPAMLGAVLPPGLVPGAVVAALAEACEGRGVAIAEVAGGWAFRTAPDLAQRLTKVVQAPRRLPRAAMEALSIIAYHQPCTRGEIEEIRGAALAQTTLEALLELGLVAPRGRREVPGRPTLWGTTPKFLEQFGLKALSDLPRKEELVTAETGPALPLGDPAEPPRAPAAGEAAAAAEGAGATGPADETLRPVTADGAAS